MTPPSDVDEIFAAAEAMRSRWPESVFVLDPEAGGEMLAQRLDRELGGLILTHSQRSGPMCRASQLLSELIAGGEIEHPDDPTLTKHVLSAAASFYGVSWRFTKHRRKAQPIDAIIALAIATRVMLAEANTGTAPREGVSASGSSVVFA